MIKTTVLAVIICASVLTFYSCSKTDSTASDNKKKELLDKEQNKTTQQQTQQNNTQQNNTQQNNTNTQTAAGHSFRVSNIGSAGAKNESVDFTWTENGTEKKLSDYKGKVVLLNFWATWCGPCKRELPDLSQLSADLKDKDVKFIGISVDEQQAAVDNFLSAANPPLNYVVLHEPNELVMKYMNATGQGDNVIPQTYIIDKKGKIVETIVGGRSKEDFLKIINKYL